MKRTLVIKPVILSNISSIQRVSARSRKPWNLFAELLEDGLKIKNKDRMIPRNTPRKMNTENPSILIVVFTYQN
jgi:hypothetical protein